MKCCAVGEAIVATLVVKIVGEVQVGVGTVLVIKTSTIPSPSRSVFAVATRAPVFTNQSDEQRSDRHRERRAAPDFRRRSQGRTSDCNQRNHADQTEERKP